MSDETKEIEPVQNLTAGDGAVASAKARLAERKEGRLGPPRLTPHPELPHTIQNDPDDEHSYLKILDTFSVSNADAAKLLFASLNRLEEESAAKGDLGPANAALALVAELEPRDAVESMLITEMVGTHMLAMECMRRANIEGQTFEGRDVNLRHAERLLRIYTQQVETLNRHRGKGQQKVTVEHVTVNDGGQAVVGSVPGNGDRFRT